MKVFAFSFFITIVFSLTIKGQEPPNKPASNFRAEVIKNMEVVYKLYLDEYVKTHDVSKDIFPNTVPREIVLRVQKLSDEELKKHGENEKESLERFRNYLKNHLDRIRMGVVQKRPPVGLTEEQAFHAKEHRDEKKFKGPSKVPPPSQGLPKATSNEKKSRWPDFLRYLLILLPVALVMGFMSTKKKKKKKKKGKKT